jgi:hypothetical protein
MINSEIQFEKFESQLAKWKAQIAQLEAKAADAAAEAKPAYLREVEELKEKMQRTRSNIKMSAVRKKTRGLMSWMG